MQWKSTNALVPDDNFTFRHNMHAVLKTALLSLLSYIIYNYIVIPVSLPEIEDFRKATGEKLPGILFSEVS